MGAALALMIPAQGAFAQSSQNSGGARSNTSSGNSSAVCIGGYRYIQTQTRAGQDPGQNVTPVRC